MNMQAFMPGEDVVREINGGVGAYNAERSRIAATLKWKLPVFLGFYIVIWLALMAVIVTSMRSGSSAWPFGIAFAAGLFGAFMVHGWIYGPARKLQQSFRDTFIPKAFGFIQNVAYRKGGTPASYPHLPRSAVGNHNRRTFDDCITGSHNGFEFEVYEADLSQKQGKSTAQVFKGVIMAFRLEKPFPGILVATKNVGGVTKFFRDLFGTGGLVQVESGDATMDGIYEFRSDNPDAARRLMSGGFVKALDELRDEWPEQPGRVALSGGDGYVLLPTRKNFFELPKVSVACEYKQHIEPMVHDISALLHIAEEVRGAAKL